MSWGERGSLPLESIPVLLLVLVAGLATAQLAVALYGTNILRASAHEAARALIEHRSVPTEARRIALDLVRHSAGGVVNDLDIDISRRSGGVAVVVRVRVTGEIEAVGPIPLPVSAAATVTKERVPL